MAISKEQIEAAKPQPVERPIESLGDVMLFRPLGSLARLGLFEAFKSAEGIDGQARVLYGIVQQCAVDAEGKLLFDSPEEVGEMAEAVSSELGRVAMEVNGFGADAIEEEAKN